MSRRPRALALALVIGVAPAGCASPTPSPGAAVGDSIMVFAAASLTDTFTTLARRFERAHPGTTVRVDFGGSSALATQIVQGAPADVFASASRGTMDQVVRAGAAEESTTFARNVMEIAVPPDNPAEITRLSDLAEPGVKLALCQAAVPCGAAADAVFANASLTVTPVTREADVRSALAKVELGEVDAAVVYVTDVLAAGDRVAGIEIPGDLNVSTDYPIATLTSSAHPGAARAFMEYVLSPDGVAALRAGGFGAP
jgi:molybdate transport system substrate-binding protein